MTSKELSGRNWPRVKKFKHGGGGRAAHVMRQVSPWQHFLSLLSGSLSPSLPCEGRGHGAGEGEGGGERRTAAVGA